MNLVTSVPLKKIINDLESGSRPKGGILEGKGEVFSIGGEHLTNDGGLNLTNVRRIPIEYFQVMKRGIVKPKDILIVKDGATTGKVSYVQENFPGLPCAINEHVFRLSIKPSLADSKYVFYYLYSPQGNHEIMLDFHGATIGGISQDFVNKVQIPLPPLPEQQYIAAILDKTDQLQRLHRYAIVLGESYLQAIFLEMFGDPSTNPKGWDTELLGKLGYGKNAIVDGPFGSSVNINIDYIPNGEIPVIRSKNIKPFEFISDDLKFITREKFHTIERSKVVPGDIILVKVGVNLGDACIFPDLFPEAVLSTTGSCKITPDVRKINLDYLCHILNYLKPKMQEISPQAVQPFLNMTHVKELEIIMPPLNLQVKFAQIVQHYERLRSRQRESLRQVEHLFQSLLTKTFDGGL